MIIIINLRDEIYDCQLQKVMVTFNRSDMKKKLMSGFGHKSCSMARLGQNKTVTIDVLMKICMALDCDISDIMEFTDEAIY